MRLATGARSEKSRSRMRSVFSAIRAIERDNITDTISDGEDASTTAAEPASPACRISVCELAEISMRAPPRRW